MPGLEPGIHDEIRRFMILRRPTFVELPQGLPGQARQMTAERPPWYGFCSPIRETIAEIGGAGRCHERHPRQAGAAAGRGAAGRRQKPHRGPAQARQTDRARAHRTAARQGLVRGARHVRRAPLQRLRHGEDQDPRRRRGHRLGHGQRPHGLSVLQGLHRVRRLALRGACGQDHQGAGHGDEGARAHHRPVRRRRRAHPGGRRRARRLWRGVQAQRASPPASFRRSA